MIRRVDEKREFTMENALGGNGSIFHKVIIEADEFKGAGRLYNMITFPPKCSIGYHIHNGESETYMVVKGKGQYSDNGTLVEIGVGDIAYCQPGDGHGLENIGDEDLVIIALVIFDKTN